MGHGADEAGASGFASLGGHASMCAVHVLRPPQGSELKESEPWWLLRFGVNVLLLCCSEAAFKAIYSLAAET